MWNIINIIYKNYIRISIAVLHLQNKIKNCLSMILKPHHFYKFTYPVAWLSKNITSAPGSAWPTFLMIIH